MYSPCSKESNTATGVSEGISKGKIWIIYCAIDEQLLSFECINEMYAIWNATYRATVIDHNSR